MLRFWSAPLRQLCNTERKSRKGYAEVAKEIPKIFMDVFLRPLRILCALCVLLPYLASRNTERKSRKGYAEVAKEIPKICMDVFLRPLRSAPVFSQ